MIIQSLLDTDLYKFTMMQVVLHHFPGAIVEYRFKCRSTGIDISPLIDEIRRQAVEARLEALLGGEQHVELSHDRRAPDARPFVPAVAAQAVVQPLEPPVPGCRTHRRCRLPL
jgi:hypothetical protein